MLHRPGQLVQSRATNDSLRQVPIIAISISVRYYEHLAVFFTRAIHAQTHQIVLTP